MKLLGNREFYHLTIILILPLTCGPRMECRAEIRLDLGPPTMINYQLSPTFKLLGNGKFNYLTIILT